MLQWLLRRVDRGQNSICSAALRAAACSLACLQLSFHLYFILIDTSLVFIAMATGEQMQGVRRERGSVRPAHPRGEGLRYQRSAIRGVIIIGNWRARGHLCCLRQSNDVTTEI